MRTAVFLTILSLSCGGSGTPEPEVTSSRSDGLTGFNLSFKKAPAVTARSLLAPHSAGACRTRRFDAVKNVTTEQVAPDGSACNRPGFADARCLAGSCMGIQKLDTTPKWSYSPPANRLMFFGGHADDAGDLFWLECVNSTSCASGTCPDSPVGPCTLVSSDLSGAIRYRAPTGAFVNLRSRLDSIPLALAADRAFVASRDGGVQSYDAKTGALIWSTDPVRFVDVDGNDSSRTKLPDAPALGADGTLSRSLATQDHGDSVDYVIEQLRQSDGTRVWAAPKGWIFENTLMAGAAGSLFVTSFDKGPPSTTVFWLAANAQKSVGGAEAVLHVAGLVFLKTWPEDRDGMLVLREETGAPEKWPASGKNLGFASALADEGALYLVNTPWTDRAHIEAPRLSALSLVDGAPLWERAGDTLAPLLLTNRHTLLQWDHKSAFLEVSTDTGELVAEYPAPSDLPGGANDFDGAVLVKGTLVVPERAATSPGAVRQLRAFAAPGLDLAPKGWVLRGGNLQRNGVVER